MSPQRKTATEMGVALVPVAAVYPEYVYIQIGGEPPAVRDGKTPETAFASREEAMAVLRASPDTIWRKPGYWT